MEEGLLETSSYHQECKRLSKFTILTCTGPGRLAQPVLSATAFGAAAFGAAAMLLQGRGRHNSPNGIQATSGVIRDCSWLPGGKVLWIWHKCQSTPGFPLPACLSPHTIPASSFFNYHMHACFNVKSISNICICQTDQSSGADNDANYILSRANDRRTQVKINSVNFPLPFGTVGPPQMYICSNAKISLLTCFFIEDSQINIPRVTMFLCKCRKSYNCHLPSICIMVVNVLKVLWKQKLLYNCLLLLYYKSCTSIYLMLLHDSPYTQELHFLHQSLFTD